MRLQSFSGFWGLGLLLRVGCGSFRKLGPFRVLRTPTYDLVTKSAGPLSMVLGLRDFTAEA